jgi:hypothetical protein
MESVPYHMGLKQIKWVQCTKTKNFSRSKNLKTEAYTAFKYRMSVNAHMRMCGYFQTMENIPRQSPINDVLAHKSINLHT